jgi:hypothetical protein
MTSLGRPLQWKCGKPESYQRPLRTRRGPEPRHAPLACLRHGGLTLNDRSAATTSPRTVRVRKPKARSTRRALVLRNGLVQGWDASVFVSAETEHGSRERKPMLVLTLQGELDEPVKKVSPFKLTVFAEAEPRRPPKLPHPWPPQTPPPGRADVSR